METFETRLSIANQKRGFLVQGLDPDISRLPEHIRKRWQFNRTMMLVHFLIAIIDATAPFVAGFKPNLSFFIDFDNEINLKFWGQETLAIICQYIRQNYPDHILILDAKDGDIGKSNNGYARRAFVGYGADAVTWNPYLGPAIETQLKAYPGKGFFPLGRTSNKEGTDLQNLQLVDGRKVFEATVDAWMLLREQGHCIGFVAGATHPLELQAIRKRVSTAPLLIPGVGEQGGDGPRVARAGYGGLHGNMLINISSASLYASDTADFHKDAGNYMSAIKQRIEEGLNHH